MEKRTKKIVIAVSVGVGSILVAFGVLPEETTQTIIDALTSVLEAFAEE